VKQCIKALILRNPEAECLKSYPAANIFSSFLSETTREWQHSFQLLPARTILVIQGLERTLTRGDAVIYLSIGIHALNFNKLGLSLFKC